MLQFELQTCALAHLLHNALLQLNFFRQIAINDGFHKSGMPSLWQE